MQDNTLATEHAAVVCRTTAAVHVLQGKASGGFSGGTIASLMGAVFDESPEELRLSNDPYCMNPPGSHRWGLLAGSSFS